jgi:hypothetical protein
VAAAVLASTIVNIVFNAAGRAIAPAMAGHGFLESALHFLLSHVMAVPEARNCPKAA